LIKSLLVVYLLALAFLSLNPWLRPSSELAIGSITWDKIDHGLAYGVLAIIIILTFRKPAPKFGLTASAVLISAAVGVTVEFLQSWLTLVREFSWFDAYANGIGAAIGALGFWSFRVLSRVIRQPRKKHLPV
jgi:VanZ family protein